MYPVNEMMLDMICVNEYKIIVGELVVHGIKPPISPEHISTNHLKLVLMERV